jgi:hypothetical protein
VVQKKEHSLMGLGEEQTKIREKRTKNEKINFSVKNEQKRIIKFYNLKFFILFKLNKLKYLINLS